MNKDRGHDHRHRTTGNPQAQSDRRTPTSRDLNADNAGQDTTPAKAQRRPRHDAGQGTTPAKARRRPRHDAGQGTTPAKARRRPRHDAGQGTTPAKARRWPEQRTVVFLERLRPVHPLPRNAVDVASSDVVRQPSSPAPTERSSARTTGWRYRCQFTRAHGTQLIDTYGDLAQDPVHPLPRNAVSTERWCLPRHRTRLSSGRSPSHRQSSTTWSLLWLRRRQAELDGFRISEPMNQPLRQYKFPTTPPPVQ